MVITLLILGWCFGTGLGLAISKEDMVTGEFDDGFWVLANCFAWPIVVSYYICYLAIKGLYSNE